MVGSPMFVPVSSIAMRSFAAPPPRGTFTEQASSAPTQGMVFATAVVDVEAVAVSAGAAVVVVSELPQPARVSAAPAAPRTAMEAMRRRIMWFLRLGWQRRG